MSRPGLVRKIECARGHCKIKASFDAIFQGGGTPPKLLLISKNIAGIIESTASKNIKWQINPYETAAMIRYFPAGGMSDPIASSSGRVKRAFEVFLVAAR